VTAATVLINEIGTVQFTFTSATGGDYAVNGNGDQGTTGTESGTFTITAP